MKKIFVSALILAVSCIAFGQKEIIKNTAHFDKITVSPKINLTLIKGDKESIRIVYEGVSADQINIEVVSGKLRIYLDEARIVDKRKRTNTEENYHSKISIYENVSVTAFVTYRELKSLEMRGAEELICEDEIKSDKFKLHVYGEAEVMLARVNAKKFKAAIYGENKIKINSGETAHQVYRLFGENKIDSRGIESTTTSARIYGEGKLRVNASDEVHVHAFGEPTLNVSGGANINKGLVFGKVNIEKVNNESD